MFFDMILHVDMDAFYASIEQRERPELRGRPVVVGADPRGRGVVSTCSYEARPFGVHSAMPIREAYRRCPQAVFLPVRMALYVQVSREVMEILHRFSPMVEPLSVDEAFLDISGCERLFGPPMEIGRKIKAAIEHELRLSCSVGIAPNKFLAKLATELGKPDGLTEIPADRVTETLGPLPVRRVFGVGKRTAAVLESMGIETVGQIAAAPFDTLAARVGHASAQHMQSLARGQDERRVEPYRLPKQLGSERTFERDLEDSAEMRRQLLGLACDVGAGLRRNAYRTASIRLKVRTEDFDTHTRSARLPRPTDSDRAIYRSACELLAGFRPSLPVRLLGIAAVDLLTEKDEQNTLFGPPEAEQKAARMDRAADAVRQRFGSGLLKPAALLEEKPRAPSVTRRLRR